MISGFIIKLYKLSTHTSMKTNISNSIINMCRIHKINNRTFYFLLYTLYFLLSTFYSHAQDSIRISGQLKNNTRYAKVVVQKFDVGIFDIAAIAIDKETGFFSTSAPSDIEQGVYRFRYSQSSQEFVDVIINGTEKAIHFTLDMDKELQDRTPVFQQSLANQQWYEWLRYEQKALLEIALIEQLLTSWPSEHDKMYAYIQKNRQKRISLFNKKRNAFIANHKNDYWAVAMVQNKPHFFANPREDWRLQDFDKRNHFWNGIETTNPKLINTHLYTDLILQYMMYYMNPEMHFSEEEMTKGFIKSVDTIMQRFGAQETTRDFALRYLQKGFTEIGMEEVLQYIDLNYAVEQCTDEEDDLKKRLAAYEALKPGSPAPNVTLTDGQGKAFTLLDLPQEQIVLVFWASWCPHCMDEMPKLNEWAKSNPETLVLAISLDEDFSAFQNAIKDFSEMLHYCDLQKWNGEIVKSYYVAATPTFILLDKEKKIVGIFSSLIQLLNTY